MTHKVLAVVGPTASGKSALGLQLAAQFSGAIISADSMQVYRQMDIGTAKPSLAEQRSVPHHLLDILGPEQPYDAGRFVADADRAIEQVHQSGLVPIVVGGTHLYLKALIHGLIPTPDVDIELKQRLYERLKLEGVAPLYQELCEVDPLTAQRLEPMDSSRVVRALSVWLSTGRSITDWHEEHEFKEQRYQPFYIAVQWEREQLYQRINQRVEHMVQSGLVEETQGLLGRGYAGSLPSLNSIGYKQAVSHLNGEISHQMMVQQIQQSTRRYAKKQLTWIKQLPDLHWVKPDELDSIHPAITAFL